MQSNLDSKFVYIAECDLRDHDLDHHLWRLLVELLDQSADLFVVARSRAENQFILHRFGHNDDLFFDLFKGIDHSRCCDFDLPFAAKEFVDRERNVNRWRILKLIDGTFSLHLVALIQTQNQRFDDFKIPLRAYYNDIVAPRIDGKPKRE